MKFHLAILLSLVITIISCQTKSSTFPAKPSDLVADEYTIQVDRDTTLHTKNGAIISIPKDAISSEDGSVTLEIKEAYSIDQMIMAGLTTSADGSPLSSGGMIYINPKDDENAKINLPISVAIPSDHYEKNMQLYEGEVKDDGSVNWVNPTPLPTTRNTEILDTGAVLFQSKCASCHSIGKDMTGPDLAHFLKRYEGEKLLVRGFTLHHPYAFLPHEKYAEQLPSYMTNDSSNMNIDSLISKLYSISPEVWLNQALYNCNMKERWGVSGQVFSNLSFDELNSIYRYIQNVSDRQDLPMPSQALDKCIDSCMVYLKATRSLQEQKTSVTQLREELINDNGPLVNVIADPTWYIDTTLFPNDVVIPQDYKGVYYQFTVTSFGWKNVDMLIKDVPGVVESELFVGIDGEYKEKVSTFLVIPSHKTYQQGGPASRNAEEFVFFNVSGKMPLPLGEKAYILAVTESESEASVAFGILPFTTSSTQELRLSLHKSSMEEFRLAIKGLNFDDFYLNVEESKNAFEIRKSDTILQSIQKELDHLEYLKPRNCDCNCLDASMPTAESANYLY